MSPEPERIPRAHTQSSYRVRFDWGPSGAAALVPDADVVVLVDVLSFTTTVTVAVEAGIDVLPYPATDGAEEYAEQHGAVLAVGRSAARNGAISLSPASIRSAQVPDRLVLPSPNGSAIAYQLGLQATRCVAACLRNTDAVVEWISSQHDAGTTVVAVVAAGERWPDGSLRPAAEDLWGAGAVIAGLAAAGWTDASPESDLARAGYRGIRGNELRALLCCASGRELVERGFSTDVEIAAEMNSSNAVPVLDDLVFKRLG